MFKEIICCLRSNKIIITVIGSVIILCIIIVCFFNLCFADNVANIVEAIMAVITGILVWKINDSATKREMKRLTMEKYDKLADSKGALHFFYHMSDHDTKKYEKAVKNDRDRERNRAKSKIHEIEDHLGDLDVFAAGIFSKQKLYDYEVFKALAFNYCRKVVIPKLADSFLKHYPSSSYTNLRYLVCKMQIDDLSDRIEDVKKHNTMDELLKKASKLKKDVNKLKNDIEKLEKDVNKLKNDVEKLEP